MTPIVSVVVTYFPRSHELGPLLDQLLAQTSRVVVVDNTPGKNNPALEAILHGSINPPGCVVIRFGENRGLATALNAGCTRALEDNPSFVLLSDQDSLPASDMVLNLLECYRRGVECNGSIAAVGPTYTDMYTGYTYPFQTKKETGFSYYAHAWAGEGEDCIDTLSLITSGMLINTNALLEVGPMRDDLFIDQIDIEWCMRARLQKFKLLGCKDARMDQRLGDQSIDVWAFGWRRESVYPPFRLYYRFRNIVALFGDKRFELSWKIRVTWYYLGLAYTHIVFGRNRLSSMSAIIRGLWDGMAGDMGESRRRFGG